MTDWDGIVREYGPTVFATAWRILGHVADTEDVVQEVFVQAYQFQQSEPVRRWAALLRRLASCRALDRLRLRRSTLPLEDSDLVGGDGPEAVARGRELEARLREAIAQLPPREASVFCLRYFDDLAYDEIATALRISPGAVATVLHKARGHLEALLLEPVGEP